MDTARADAAAWFPAWAAEHLGLTCQVCVKWGGPALCAAIEGERRGVAALHGRADAAAEECDRCDGCGRIADSEDGEPWTAWTELPLGSSAAVLMGLVKPIPCPDCSGTGRTP